MKVLRGIALGFWVVVMTTCVSLVAAYYILSQTLLSPSAVKGWFASSGAYGQLAEVVTPKLTTTTMPGADQVVTTDMIQRAVKASITPENVKAKVEPMIDAVYAWLDSKSPDITFSISTSSETERFLTALRGELVTKLKALPTCNRYVAPEELIAAQCLPPYATVDEAADVIMEKVREQESLRTNTLTPDTFGTRPDGVFKRLPDLISYLWVAQLIAMPVFALVALFLVARRRAGGLIAVASSLLGPGIVLIILAVILQVSGVSIIEPAVAKDETAQVLIAVAKEAIKSVTRAALQTGAILTVIALAAGGLGVWWRKRRRHI